ncbi:MAG: RHS repeat-associated core domain-containing protein, partial [Oscillospiraceae bacterium]|nr:RHS repeat-associated core domain-containing protein [Oscillospiraceae bacterium]
LDGRGSLSQILNEDKGLKNQFRYDPFGIITKGNVDTKAIYGFNGEEYDPISKTQYLRARNYKPSTGRFITKDTYLGEIVNPYSLNLYSFVENNPIKYVDPSGNIANPTIEGNTTTPTKTSTVSAPIVAPNSIQTTQMAASHTTTSGTPSSSSNTAATQPKVDPYVDYAKTRIAEQEALKQKCANNPIIPKLADGYNSIYLNPNDRLAAIQFINDELNLHGGQIDLLTLRDDNDEDLAIKGAIMQFTGILRPVQDADLTFFRESMINLDPSIGDSGVNHLYYDFGTQELAIKRSEKIQADTNTSATARFNQENLGYTYSNATTFDSMWKDIGGFRAGLNMPTSIGYDDTYPQYYDETYSEESKTTTKENTNLKFGENDLVYGPNANGELWEFKTKNGGKILQEVADWQNDGLGDDPDAWFWRSTIAMENAVAEGNKIHFDLTNVRNIDGALGGYGPYANSVTSLELKYLFDNWDTYKDTVIFYKKGSVVNPPWIK